MNNDRIVGFIVGASEDGYIYYRKNKNEYGVETEQLSKEWLLNLQDALKIAFNKKSNIRKTKKGYFRLNVYSKEIYLKLTNIRNNITCVLDQPEEFQIGFLQGVFDAEGSVSYDRNCIRVCSKREDLIELIKVLLQKFEIKFGKMYKDKNNVITIPIYGKENMLRFSEKINFSHPFKKERLRRKFLYDLQNGVVAGESS